MKIPSPRTFIEIVSFVLLAVFLTVGVILATFLLVVFNAIERAVDGARNWRKGRRA